jgi:hypothetical protein
MPTLILPMTPPGGAHGLERVIALVDGAPRVGSPTER